LTWGAQYESKFNTAIQPINTAIIRQNGGVELIFGFLFVKTRQILFKYNT